MDCTGFSAAQQQALLDLLVLAMYADGHLTNAEDAQLLELLQAMGFTEPSDREREFDAAVTRVRPSVQSILKAKDHAIRLAAAFTTRAQQKQVYATVQKIMLADNNVSTWENTLLTELDSKFRM